MRFPALNRALSPVTAIERLRAQGGVRFAGQIIFEGATVAAVDENGFATNRIAVFDKDESSRANTAMKGLQKLKPFSKQAVT